MGGTQCSKVGGLRVLSVVIKADERVRTSFRSDHRRQLGRQFRWRRWAAENCGPAWTVRWHSAENPGMGLVLRQAPRFVNSPRCPAWTLWSAGSSRTSSFNEPGVDSSAVTDEPGEVVLVTAVLGRTVPIEGLPINPVVPVNGTVLSDDLR